jgi:hypothetical protein
VLLPLTLYSIVFVYIIMVAKWDYETGQHKFTVNPHQQKVQTALFRTLNLLMVAINLISCLILVLVLRLVFKMTTKVGEARNEVSAKIKFTLL